MISSRLGISLPNCLGSDFDTTWDLAERGLGKGSRAFRLFSMGWHGVGYRAVTIEEYAARYSRLPGYGSAGHEGNFREDQALVDYLLNACSTIDCLVFAAFSIGSGLDANSFPTDKSGLRGINRRFVAERYEVSWSAERLSALLVDIRDSPGIKLLFDIRDVVTHRGGLPRTLYVGGEFGGRVTIPSIRKAMGRVVRPAEIG
jgi:hypothetical protein